MVWAVPLSLATTYGIDSLYFPAVTEMFHFAACDFNHLIYSDGDDTLRVSGFPIRISPDQSVFAAPRSFSQLTASFIVC